ncbi:glycosyltransferase family 2 protein [Paenibacillus tarimensis]
MKKKVSSSRVLFGRGYNSGYDSGFSQGYTAGWNEGIESWSRPFEGTSIVIPTYNQKELLKQCIESIEAYTPEPHETIIIDNGSQDGTLEYLQSLRGKIRFKRSETNLGFARGMNQGLMMARGSTILLLNNDTVVTRHWLRNLLFCLHGFPKVGLVGPVTNYISGGQQIETSYQSLEEMHAFSSAYNQSDPAAWRSTGRMTGFCVLMTRDTFTRLGYFDEGFEIGNCEDDDYSLRARMLGLELVIAGDTFIHHVGSASMKALGDRMDTVYGRNLAYFSEKWGETRTVLDMAGGTGNENPSYRMTDFYPTHVLVKGAGPEIYWIENGSKHPVIGAAEAQAVRLSQTDLRNWPLGSSIQEEERASKAESLASIPSPYGPLAEGVLVNAPDGKTYQSDRGRLRPLTGSRALSAWQIDSRSIYPITEEVEALYPKGLPIIAPIVLQSGNL